MHIVNSTHSVLKSERAEIKRMIKGSITNSQTLKRKISIWISLAKPDARDVMIITKRIHPNGKLIEKINIVKIDLNPVHQAQ